MAWVSETELPLDMYRSITGSVENRAALEGMFIPGKK
jgi:hypothetical protein